MLIWKKKHALIHVCTSVAQQISVFTYQLRRCALFAWHGTIIWHEALILLALSLLGPVFTKRVLIPTGHYWSWIKFHKDFMEIMVDWYWCLPFHETGSSKTNSDLPFVLPSLKVMKASSRPSSDSSKPALCPTYASKTYNITNDMCRSETGYYRLLQWRKETSP